MEAQVQSFLMGVGLVDLLSKGVLTNPHLLQTPSVYPLLDLMRERGVDILRDDTGEWSLNVNGDFVNSTSLSLESGNMSELQNLGDIFEGKNTLINPFCPRGTGTEE